MNIDVIVVGAGPTGVAAATLLGQCGIRCVVLDRYEGVYPQPRAVHLDDEIYRILARLGVADGFARISRPARGLRLLRPDHTVLAEFRRDPSRSPHGFPQANMFDQPELERLLRANLATYPSVVLRGNAEVVAVAEDGEGVRVGFVDRADESRHELRARFVLGCDGANSMVRTAIGTQMKDMRFEQRWLVVDVKTDANLRRWDGVEQVCDPRRAATYMRIGPDRYRWEFRLRRGETAADFDPPTTVRSLIGPWVSETDDDAMDLVRVAEYTFRAKLADHWRRGNVFLLGDAAHLTPPFIGQGMCAGLRDAMNLSWKLAGVLRGELPGCVLASYETERKPHARSLIRMALALGWMMTAGNVLGEMVRNVLLARVASMAAIQSIFDGVTPVLRRSAVVIKPGRLRQLAGSLCPNVLLSDGNRLDDVLGNAFGLITVEAMPNAASEDLRARGVVVITAEPGSELRSWLDRGRAQAAIIRPDRAVMRAGRTDIRRRAVIRRLPWASTLRTSSP